MAEWTEAEITTTVSPRSVADTVSRLTGILSAKGLKVFAVIDQQPMILAGLQQTATQPLVVTRS